MKTITTNNGIDGKVSGQYNTRNHQGGNVVSTNLNKTHRTMNVMDSKQRVDNDFAKVCGGMSRNERRDKYLKK